MATKGKTGKEILKGEQIAEGLHKVCMKSPRRNEKSLIVGEEDKRLWHERLSHVGQNTVKKTLGLMGGITLQNAAYMKFEACEKGNSTRKPRYQQTQNLEWRRTPIICSLRRCRSNGCRVLRKG